MKILSIETCSAKSIIGYVDDGQAFKSFELTPDSPPVFGPDFPKQDFRDLEHFAGVIGKFDPHAFILAMPIEIEELSFKEIRKIFLTDERFETFFQ